MKAQQTARKDDSMPIKASIIFEMFPFCILYNVIFTLKVSFLLLIIVFSLTWR